MDTADDSSRYPWKEMVSVCHLSSRKRRHNEATHRGKKEEAALEIRFYEIGSDRPPDALVPHLFQMCEVDPGKLPLILIAIDMKVGTSVDGRGEDLLAQGDALLVGQHTLAAEPYDRSMPVTERDHVFGHLDLHPRSLRPAVHDACHREAAGFWK